ncbi:MAG: MBL fold metallo-hydrolase [Clostridia bacterium]|nr:MBL fold metallo-hydrolase [Clostridia bacterium]
MKIKYLGTAAAEGIPAIFCECDNCKKSRKAGGRNIRTRSQALIDNTLLIDFPADTYMHFLEYELPLAKIKNCLITHSHSDHLYPAELIMRKKGFSHINDEKPLVFYSDEAGYNDIKAVKEEKNISDDDILVNKIKLFKEFEVEDYKVTALRAAHDPKSSPVVYIIEKDGKTLFYSNDTSEYPDESMEYLKSLNKPFNLISFDCTEACRNATYVGHLTLDRCIALREKLFEAGAADEKTIFVLNHFSHNGTNVVYDEFVQIAKANKFEVSYDGMEIEF